MPGLLGHGETQRHRVLYVTPEGREYWLILVSMGGWGTVPPFVITETADGLFETVGGSYTSLETFAIEHGCVLGEVTGVEPTN